MNPSDAIEAIEKPLSSLPYSLSRHILEHLRKLTSHEPVIGIMGKSGAGKSSLCNALFQGEVTPVSDVHAGTREVRRFRLFRPVHPVVAVSARTGWELDTLVSALMTALPDHAASPLMTRLQDELRTESVRSQAREQFTGAVDRIFDTAESVCIASVARTVLRAVRDSVVSVARAVWNWIFF
ncbi:50S ribosome-binding GTPase [Escherichia coli]|nr:50S ribosome-binding GTPase [Escherichia coli]